MFQYRTFPSPYVPPNFLHPFRFICSLPPLTSPPIFVVSISELPRHQQLLACILSQYLNSPHPVPGPKKRVRRQGPKNNRPNVSAYNNGVPPHPMEARSTKQVHGSKKQKPSSETIHLAVEKKKLGPAQIHAGPKKISPQGPENTQASPPHFL